MAATLTHFYIVREYLKKQGIEVSFNNKDPFYAAAFLGATGPDLFYMRDGHNYISNFHHYKNPGIFVKILYDNQKGKSEEYIKLSNYFIQGFLSHMAADLVIHPFVNSLVGKYQEHLVTSVEIPGPVLPGGSLETPTLSDKFCAHNIVEFAQDYYVQTYLFKKNTYFKRTSTMFTYAIEKQYKVMGDILFDAIQATYNIDVPRDDIDSVLDFYCDKYQSVDIQDHVDMVIEDEYKHFEIFLQHIEEEDAFKQGSSSFDKLLTRAINLTASMVAEGKNFNKIMKPWNLDTGLYTQVKVEKNAIKLNLNNYESVWS